MAPVQFNHTMFRSWASSDIIGPTPPSRSFTRAVKDPKVSLDFYQRIIGMELIHEMDGGSFVNYFMAFPLEGQESLSKEEKAQKMFERSGILELCWNKGTEDDKDFSYCSGNDDASKGFGHIALSVDDVEEACKRYDSLGVKFKKRPEEGRMRHITDQLVDIVRLDTAAAQSSVSHVGATASLEAQVQNKRRSVEAKQAELDELDRMLAAVHEREQHLKARLGATA
ncbi:Lactoylglutathione lyase [Microbotryomycetes sp. JL201]|nr:Lactoylglutathione lyase [Microbotryomycetes sp. JL201]